MSILGLAASDESTILTAGVKTRFRAQQRQVVNRVKATLTQPSTSGAVEIDILVNDVSIFSTLLTIDASEPSSATAAVPAVIANTTIEDDDEIKVEVTDAGVGAIGLKVWLGLTDPTIWWTHPRPVAIPPNQWCPHPFNQVGGVDQRVDTHDVAQFTEVSTTIAAASDSAVLPANPINVADTSAFPSSGWLVIEGPPGAGVDTVVKYGNKTATTFTGTGATASPHSTGTLATGQTVRLAFVSWPLGDVGYLWMSIGQVGIANLATTAYARVQFFQRGAINIIGGTCDYVGLDQPDQMCQAVMQPGVEPGTTAELRVRHNDSVVRNSIVDGIQAPMMMQVQVSDFK